MAMKRLELKCRECRRQVLLNPEDVILHHDHAALRGTYAFRCPSCGAGARREALGNGIRLLRAAGVTVDTHAGGPPLTTDDLLDLLNDLKDL